VAVGGGGGGGGGAGGGGGGGEILNQELHQRSQISALCHGQKTSMQGPDSGAYKNFILGFNHINVNVQNLFRSLNAVWLLHITFN